MLRIAIAQINPIVGDLKENTRKILAYACRAQSKGADLVVFPEMAVCGYPPEDLLYKEHFVEDNIRSLKFLNRQIKGIAAIVGFVDHDRNQKIYNAAAFIDNGRLRGVYRKEQLPNYGVFDERRYFEAGKGNPCFAWKGVRLGVSVCEDIWIEQGPWLRQSRFGAKLLLNISSSPYDMGKLEQRIKLLKKRARQAKAYICYANLVGGQDELVFDGGSFIVDPHGRIIASGSQFEEDLIVADLDLGKKTHPGRERLPVHRAAFYGRFERVYKALVLGTRDYVRKNNFRDVLLGLSGGIDSSLVAAIAADAVGRENVTGVSMPSRFSSTGTRTDARLLARNLGIKFWEVPIEKMFEAYLTQLEKIFGKKTFGIAEENLQARIRGTMLMTLSNRWGSLVLTTGNKSEVGVGYCTLYGDMSGGFAVIKDVPKTMVYELARLVNEKAGKELISKSVIDRAPTAELKENQKDQDFLPPYPDLDKMLKEYVEEHRSLAYMARRNDKDLVKKVIDMVDRNEYKRRQAPPGIKITPRAFGKDWRLPITNKYREG